MTKSSVREITYLQDFRQTQRTHQERKKGERKGDEERERENGTKTRKVPGRCAGFRPDLALPPISISLNDDHRAYTRARASFTRRYVRGLTLHTYTRTHVTTRANTSAGYARDRDLRATETAA